MLRAFMLRAAVALLLVQYLGATLLTQHGPNQDHLRIREDKKENKVRKKVRLAGVHIDVTPQDNITIVGDRDLAFMHIPYNFGHTVEKVAIWPRSSSRLQAVAFMRSHMGGLGSRGGTMNAKQARGLDMKIDSVSKNDADKWGHWNVDLHAVSNVTGCSLYFSPQKYWPEDVAKKYFGDKKVFGLLRNPFERLVAMFRGSMEVNLLGSNYGTGFNKLDLLSCNVNKGLKKVMKKYISSDTPFQSSCAFLPQAEFFEGPYGISLPVDNLMFPSSMNKVFGEHNYTHHIQTPDIIHVSSCNEKWSGDLDSETKALIRQVYAKDFALLCKHFGYCDDNEDVCIHEVPEMCPRKQCKLSPCAALD